MDLGPRERAAIDRFRPGKTLINRAIAWLVINWSRYVMLRRNRLTIDGLERLQKLHKRGERGLLTFSNHVSRLDDPLLVSCFGLHKLPYDQIRWVSADARVLFGGPIRAFIFSAGKCVPTVRGAGIDQMAMHFLSERLQAGDWVHIFPEGGASRDPEGLLRHPFKAGLGRLIAESKPLALPFYHQGMQRVAPPPGYKPSSGHEAQLLFGDPVDCDDAFIERVAPSGEGIEAWKEISQWSHGVLAELERRLLQASSN